jgi:nucleoside phosphorylase
VGAVILVTACFPIELRWIARRPGLRVVRTAMGEASGASLDRLGDAAADTTMMISTGFAGGIDPRAARGDLALARTVRHRDEEIGIDPELVDRARRALNDRPCILHVGPCASADRVLGPDEKRALAEHGVTSVDMESGPLARWASARGIPFLALRAVLDPADTELPFSADRPLWTSVLRHPIAGARSARHAVAVGRRLGRAVNAVVDVFSGGPDV